MTAMSSPNTQGVHVPSGQGELVASKYYLLAEEIYNSPESLHEEIMLKKIEDPDGKREPMYLCRKDFYSLEWEAGGNEQEFYYGHPLYDSIELAMEAYKLGIVWYVEVTYNDGVVETGFAQSVTYPSGSPLVVIRWIDESSSGISSNAFKRIDTTRYEC